VKLEEGVACDEAAREQERRREMRRRGNKRRRENRKCEGEGARLEARMTHI
jgi:hypothetical protein